MKIILSSPKTSKNTFNTNVNDLLEKYSDIKFDYNTKKKAKRLSLVNYDIIGYEFHQNYLRALEIAWANHYGIVLTPDIVWHTLLSEVVSIVAEFSDYLAYLFTKNPGAKVDILVPTNDLQYLPLPTLMECLRPNIPLKIDLFLPEFTTTNNRSRLAKYASFADLVSPFYNYMTFMCGIPFIELKGTVNDWNLVKENWIEIGKSIKMFPEYFFKVSKILENIPDGDVDFWQNIFYIKECGSGGQTEAFGWFTDFFRKTPDFIRFTENFSSHVSKVCYKNLETNNKYELFSGIFGSVIDNDCMIPEFGTILYKSENSSLQL
jgi:hypothetical protein